MSIPRVEALALPILVEQTTSEAHADMKNQTIRGTCGKTHCIQKDTTMTCISPHGVDIITPGTSTVAKFKTKISMCCKIRLVSNRASSKRLFHYVAPRYPPCLLAAGLIPRKRLGVCRDTDASASCACGAIRQLIRHKDTTLIQTIKEKGNKILASETNKGQARCGNDGNGIQKRCERDAEITAMTVCI